MSPEARTFIEAWLRDNAPIIDDVVRLEGQRLGAPYGAAVARLFAAMDTERRPDA